MNLAGIRACVFDAYGTLFDLNSATALCLAELGPKAEALNRLWREKQLQYTWLRAAQQRHADFWQVTGDALDCALATLGMPAGGLREKFMQSYLVLDVFPEVPAVLQQIKGAGFKLAILSNGTPDMLQSAVGHAHLDGLFDAVLSVEEVGIFKPHPRVYSLATQKFDLPAGQIAFVSSNAWDAHAASAFGMRVIWCNRYRQQPENLPGKPDFEVRSIAEIPALVCSH